MTLLQLSRSALISLLLCFCLNSSVIAAAYLQVIQLVNFLANTNLSNMGMTPTSVTAQFYTASSSKPCWSTVMPYLADFTIRSGTGQNCTTAITKITILPSPVASLLQTYIGPIDINIDPTKYSSQIMIVQNTAPVFSSTSGLVTTPGTITSQAQAQLIE